MDIYQKCVNISKYPFFVKYEPPLKIWYKFWKERAAGKDDFIESWKIILEKIKAKTKDRLITKNKLGNSFLNLFLIINLNSLKS